MKQLKSEIQDHPDVDMILFPEGYFKEEKMNQVCQMAKGHNTYIVAGLKDKNNKDRAFIVNPSGEIILERAKTPENDKLFTPSKIVDNELKLGYLLCREVFLGMDGLDSEEVDVIFNPIGVGMYSEEQFVEWTSEARKIAIKQKAYVIGCSHADGSYRNCGFSIPIAFCFDDNGNEILVSKNNTQTYILDIEVKKLNQDGLMIGSLYRGN